MAEPIDWTEVLTAELCSAVASGAAIADIAGKNGFPSAPSIYRHMAAEPAFRARMDEARAAQQDFEADEMVRMADAATVEDHQVVKLRIWARQWRASKLAPKRYGDRQVLAGDPDAPLHKPVDVADVLAELKKLEKSG